MPSVYQRKRAFLQWVSYHRTTTIVIGIALACAVTYVGFLVLLELMRDLVNLLIQAVMLTGVLLGVKRMGRRKR